MIGLVADENLDARIVSGLRRRLPQLNFVTIQEVGLSGAPDPQVLAWAARHERVLVSHDVSTMPAHAYRHLDDGQSFAGLLMVPASLAIGRAIDDLALIVELADQTELENRVELLPLRGE